MATSSTPMPADKRQELQAFPYPPLYSEEYVPKTMPNVLGPFDMTATFAIGLFLLPGATLTATVGVVGLSYLIIGALVFFVPCLIATTQLSKLLPHEGSLYNWSYRILGPFWGLFTSICFWLSSVLAQIAGLNGIVTFIQGLNHGWLTEAWQQGLAIIIMALIVGAIALQRTRTIHKLFNMGFFLVVCAILLIGLSAVVWLVTGHHSMTAFHHPADWAPQAASLPIFGLIALNYIGTSGPLNMAGEMRPETRHIAIPRHLLWGGICIFLFYFIPTIAILVVRGPAILTAPVLSFEAITTVDVTLGKFLGNVTFIFAIFGLFLGSVFYVENASRLLMVAGIDNRLPVTFARLNKYRSPSTGILITVGAVIILTIIVFLMPYVLNLGAALNVATMFFNVISGGLTIIWTIATSFFFINVFFLAFRKPQTLARARFLPPPVLWACMVIGLLASIGTILDTALYSWTPIMSNQNWFYSVGVLTVSCLIVSVCLSLFANSEASWQTFSRT